VGVLGVRLPLFASKRIFLWRNRGSRLASDETDAKLFANIFALSVLDSNCEFGTVILLYGLLFICCGPEIDFASFQAADAFESWFSVEQ